MDRPNLNISEMSNNETDALHGEDELGNLGLTAFNQDEFEKDVMEKVNKEMKDSENLRLRNIRDKSLKKTEYGMRSLNTEVSSLQSSINLLTRQLKVNFDVEGKKKLIDLQASHASKLKELADMKANRMKLLSTLNKTDNASLEEALGLSIKQTEETERERLIRTGVIMPFDVTPDQKASTSKQAEPGVTSFEQYLLDQSQKTSERHGKKTKKKKIQKRTQNVAKIKTESPLKKRKLTKSHSTPLLQKSRDQARKASKNIFDATSAMVKKRSASELEQSSSRMDTRDRTGTSRIQHNFSEDIALSSGEEVYEDEIYKDRCANDVDDDYNPSDMSDEYYEEDYEPKQSRVSALPKHRKSKMFMDTSELTSRGKRKKSCSSGDESLDEIKHKFGARKCAKAKNRATDDGDNQMYKDRLRKYTKQKAKRKYKQLNEHDDQADSEDELVSVSGQFKIPVVMWNKLYSYQQTCVRWLWELHIQECGGIMGDEMGLGKTIQTIAFLTALKVTKHHDAYFTGLGPTILICPATVMHQWVRELHKWWPEFRVAILHSSGSYTCTDSSLIHSIVRSNGILITSYTSVVKHRPALLEHDWHYVILDEGHKIRNPDAQATIACKQFRTSHRLILSGSPIQNNLRELWSLFDFVFPGKLGTLPDFMQHFSVPIVQGGYSNASQIQVQTAYKCASVLRDTINPYLLRRMKADVKQILNLPSKNEQVLFCRLTKEQRDVYQEYIDSKECQMILSREFMIFPGLITLRKICNHPDLCTGGPGMLTSRNYDDEQLTYGHKDRSGKLIVVASLLKLWKKQGQRVLLFTQSKQMLDIMETFVQSEHYQYLRMDGGTGVASRQPLINKFNEDEKYFLFLLTTRVGGLGINLTGANRVVIFDPDWNPSTDMQARERAWRIGQQKQVTVYRLLTAGTIEEKIYHRQIFKQFLCNRVLKDPKQRRFFKSNDLFELFTLGTDDSAGHTETGAIFAGTGTVITEKSKSKLKKNNTEKKSKTNRFDEIRASIEERKNGHTSVTEEEKEDDDEAEMIRQLGEERRQKMREMAKKLSMKISKDVLQRKDSAKSEPTTEGCSNIQIVQGSAHSIVKPEPSPDDTVHPCAMHPGNIIKEEPLWDSDQYGTGSNVYDEQTDLGSTNEGIKEEPSCTVRDSSVCIKQEPQSDGEVTEDQPSTSFQPTPFTSGLLDFNQLVSNSDRAIVKKSDVHKPRKLKPAKSTIKKHSKKHTSTGKAKKKKKKRKDIVFEGEVIPNLLRQSALQQSDEKEAEQNDYVLQRLLKKSGVSSALQHDKIMMSSSPDYVIIESEAERIAKQAARALKQSRSRCNPAQTGRPTWTGQQGTVAKPRFGQKKNALVRHAESTVNPATSTTVSEETTAEDKVMTWNTNVNKPLTADEREKNPAKKLPSTPALFDGTLAGQRQTSTPSTNQNAGKQSSVNTMTSADLLTAMRLRNHLSGLTNQDSDSDNNDIVENVPTDNMELITDIRNFISFQGSVDGQATTEEILSEFKTRIDPTDSVTFKSMLKEICNFDKNNGVGLWQLKQQYR